MAAPVRVVIPVDLAELKSAADDGVRRRQATRLHERFRAALGELLSTVESWGRAESHTAEAAFTPVRRFAAPGPEAAKTKAGRSAGPGEDRAEVAEAARGVVASR